MAKDSETEEELEELLLSTLSYSINEEPPKPNTVQFRPMVTKFGPNSINRERSQSLYSFGNNARQRQNVLSSPISEQPESLETLTPENRVNSMTLPRSSRPSKKLKRLNSLLFQALRDRGVEEINKLIIAGANPNATCCIEKVSACHLAAMRSDGALAVLLRGGGKRLQADRTGRTPLHLAAWAGNVREIAMLLGFSKDLMNRLSVSTMTKSLEEEVKQLSHYTKDLVNVKCTFNKSQMAPMKEHEFETIDYNSLEFEKTLPLFQPGWTPLHAASSRANSHCVWLLLAAGANPCSRDIMGRTPLDIAGSTYYSEHNIDPECFADTVSLLSVEKCSISIKNRKTIDTPLHTAVELDSKEAVRALLSVDVPLYWANRAGLTPMHMCVKKKSREIFQILVNNGLEYKDEMYLQSPVDMRDKDGYTVLHAAILEGWEEGVQIALESGATITAKDNDGETALHLAATVGNIDIMKKILSANIPKEFINARNSLDETPLVKAVKHGHIACVQSLLEEKASIKYTLPDKVNVFHLAAEKGYFDILQVLLDDDYILTREIVNFITEDKYGFGPIHYAVQNNHAKCLKLLLSRNAYISLKSSSTGQHLGSSPLHIAAIHNNVNIAKIIIKNSDETVHNVNDRGWTPLHTACHYGSRDIIGLLLKEGADLACAATGLNKGTKTTPLDLIMNSLSRPSEFLSHIFDKCISTNDCDIQEPNCEVTVDYQILVPTKAGHQQMKVVEALLNTGNKYGQTRLLVHPLLEGFLHLKWKALIPFFYTMILVYGIYVVILTMYVMSEFFYRDTRNNRPSWIEPSVVAIILYVVAFVVVALEVLYVNINFKYFLQLETWIKFGSIALAISLPSLVLTFKKEKDEIPRHVATISLLMAWLEMMFLWSRFPTWGFYVLMFAKVSYNVVKVLLTFSFLVIGFSLSFMVQFHHEEPFNGVWPALVKTLAMLTSEFEYEDLMKTKIHMNITNGAEVSKLVESPLPSLILVRCIFVIFLILAAIVLMNLMVGVAVHDLHDLQVLGNVRRLSKQVEFLVSLDRLFFNRFIRKLLPKSFQMHLINRRIVLDKVVLRPSDPKSEGYKDLPPDIIEAIYETAQLRRKQMEDEMGNQNYKKKIDEIHQATVVKVKKQKSLERIINARKYSLYDLKGKSNLETLSKKIIDLDSGISNGNKFTTESLAEMKYAISNLEAKMDLILNQLQGGQTSQGKNYFNFFKTDKPKKNTNFYTES